MVIPSHVLNLVEEERKAQDRKWGRKFKGRTDQHWLTILIEELGEVSAEVLQSPKQASNRVGSDDLVEAEIVQCAAVLLAWLEFRSPFHEQIARDVDVPAPYEIVR